MLTGQLHQHLDTVDAHLDDLQLPVGQPRVDLSVLADPFDLGFEGVDDQGVDDDAFDPGDGLSVVGEVFGQANGGLRVVSGPSDSYEPFTLPR